MNDCASVRGRSSDVARSNTTAQMCLYTAQPPLRADFGERMRTAPSHLDAGLITRLALSNRVIACLSGRQQNGWNHEPSNYVPTFDLNPLGAKTVGTLIEIVRQSLSTLWAHKLRSFLTMFGIAWGVGSLLLLVGLGEGFRSGQQKQLANLGRDIMFVFPGRIPALAGSLQSGQKYHFTFDDYLAIRDQAHTLRSVSPVINREDIRAVSEYGSTNGQVFGVAPIYNEIRNVPLQAGRWFNDADDSEVRRVAVVGWELLKNVFPGRPAVGST